MFSRCCGSLRPENSRTRQAGADLGSGSCPPSAQALRLPRHGPERLAAGRPLGLRLSPPFAANAECEAPPNRPLTSHGPAQEQGRPAGRAVASRSVHPVTIRGPLPRLPSLAVTFRVSMTAVPWAWRGISPSFALAAARRPATLSACSCAR